MLALLGSLLGGGCDRSERGRGGSKAALQDQPSTADVKTNPGTSPPPPSATATTPAAASGRAPAPPPVSLTPGGTGVVRSSHGMVTSVHEAATRAGVRMLEAGGNAVDAAVAVAYALAVTHPSAGNIGGGGFMLVQFRGHPTVAIDFRERAPAALTQQGFDQMIDNHAREPRATGVPGSVAGLELAHQTFGKLPRSRVMAPAIELARDGHSLGGRQATVLGWAWTSLSKDAKRLFGHRGKPLATGEQLVQPELARTLQRIAERGSAGFYEGPVAEAIASYMSSRGGWISTTDLRQYRAVRREPLHTTYRGLDVDVMPPPSAGGVSVVLMLRMLERLAPSDLPVDSVARLHLFAEVAKRAHAERRFEVVDPDSVTPYDDAGRRARWEDPELWLGRFPVSPSTVTPASKLHPLYPAAVRELDNTTHFSVVDARGNAVSCTTTLSGSFGAKYVIPEIGVVMNNSVGAFGTAGLDVPKPGRRMTSSMSPTIVSFERTPLMVLGSPGGDTIPNTVVQVLQNLVDGGDDLARAIDRPRIHHGFVPDAIRFETLRPPPRSTLAGLRQLGHVLTQPRQTIGDANNIVIIDGEMHGYADPREGGLALAPTSAGTGTEAAGSGTPPASDPHHRPSRESRKP